MLQRAVRWFAKGEREDHIDDRKLSYVTVIDLFFSQVGPGATKRICQGFAFAMAPKDDGIPGLANYMFKVFSSRSETSHAGVVGVMTQGDLEKLRHVVLNFVIAMVLKPFNTKADVEAWMTQRARGLSKKLQKKLADATNWKKKQSTAGGSA